MAKVKGPLFSLEAHGQFGKTIIYQGSPSGTRVFCHFVPYDPKSAGQLAIREYIRKGVYYWQHMSAPYKAEWNDFVT
jgi:hypothetical protein